MIERSRFRLLQYKDGTFFLIRPAADSDLELLDYLLSALSAVWNQLDLDTNQVIADYWQLAAAAAAKVKTDPLLQFDPDRVRSEPILFQQLFLRESLEEPDPILVQLHKFEPLCQRIPPTPGQPITAKNLPFPTCGIPALDRLASLMAAFGGRDGWDLYYQMDAQAIDHISFVLNELNRPEDERIVDYLNLLYQQNKARLFPEEEGEDKAAAILRRVQQLREQGQRIE